MPYQFLGSQRKFLDPTQRGRRVWTSPTGEDWCALLYFNLPNPDDPFQGYESDKPYPGGYPPYTYQEWLESQVVPPGLPALPMYKDEFEAMLTIAQEYLGYNYVWGGKTPPYFDCSGFVGYVYKTVGFIPQDVISYTGTLWEACYKVDSPYYGDLVFWADPDSKTPDGPMAHVAIYLGPSTLSYEFHIIDCARGGVDYRHGYTTHPDFFGFFRPKGR